MDTTVTKTTKSGITITVKWSAAMLDKELDGYVYGQEMVSCCESITLTKPDGSIIVTGKGSMSTSYPDMPTGAAGVIRGRRDNKEIVQPVGEEIYNLLLEALDEAKASAESDCDRPKEKPEPEMVVNPEYAHMSRDEITAAETRYDAIHNEGGEGYNPYRDNLYIAK